jgi:gamma-glutamylcyclotransferase (GGCT)/AIG2-like uncharacterized protein YtfP
MRDSKQYSGDGTVATMADKMFYYFAYGSNMDEDQMEYRCPGARLLHKVTIPDYTFRIDSRGVASIIPKRGAKVTGLLWEINKYHILSLDRFEGIKGRYYRRVAVPLEHEGRTITAIAYLSNSNCDRQYTPKPGYMEKIIKAAKVHGFDDAYIRELETFLQ